MGHPGGGPDAADFSRGNAGALSGFDLSSLAEIAW
jgi:hypothetical protein